MTAERGDDPCASFAAERLRLECGDAAVPPAGLRAHLETCARCRGAVESARELVAGLRGALAPEPLPAALSERILARVAANRARRGRPGRWPLRLGLAAAAAAAAGLLLLPPGRQRTAAPTPAGLSQGDARAIVQALELLGWSSTLDYGAECLMAQIQEVVAESVLPWGPDDDWDAPQRQEESRGPCPVPQDCA